MRKVCVVVASRANYGRSKSVLTAIKNHPDLELQLIVSASALLYRFGNAIEIIKKDGFIPDATVYMVIEGETPSTMAKSTGLAILELATLFENLKPDIVLTTADRYETMATAVAASYMNIPLAHTQGGEITGSIDESVRHAITKLAHIHFPATEKSRERLIKMGEEVDRIYLTGCPAIDIITDIDLSLDGVFERYGGVGARIHTDKQYIVVLQHPVTTEFGSAFDQINQTLQAVKELHIQTIWLWPNVDAGTDAVSKGLRMFREKYNPDYVHFYRNFSPEDYARIIYNCSCLVGNSSSAIREGSYLGIPSVNIGTRQHGRERGRNVIDVGHDSVEIKNAIETQIKHSRYERDILYGTGSAGKDIAEILAGCSITIQKKLSY
ncbi:MAG: UDP-N-acetylglucosamine 2-epimerase (hydrolyzing) [Nitrospirae bacterium]|nr:UDP-N-acetylglucosamine 2-epimerase (hydrolyzing) [Nitrospirota bacterium]